MKSNYILKFVFFSAINSCYPVFSLNSFFIPCLYWDCFLLRNGSEIIQCVDWTCMCIIWKKTAFWSSFGSYTFKHHKFKFYFFLNVTRPGSVCQVESHLNTAHRRSRFLSNEKLEILPSQYSLNSAYMSAHFSSFIF